MLQILRQILVLNLEPQYVYSYAVKHSFLVNINYNLILILSFRGKRIFYTQNQYHSLVVVAVVPLDVVAAVLVIARLRAVFVVKSALQVLKATE